MIALFHQEVEVRAYCQACGKVAVLVEGTQGRVLAGERLPEGCLPDGWWVVDGRPYCPCSVVVVRARAPWGPPLWPRW